MYIADGSIFSDTFAVCHGVCLNTNTPRKEWCCLTRSRARNTYDWDLSHSKNKSESEMIENWIKWVSGVCECLSLCAFRRRSSMGCSIRPSGELGVGLERSSSLSSIQSTRSRYRFASFSIPKLTYPIHLLFCYVRIFKENLTNAFSEWTMMLTG